MLAGNAMTTLERVKLMLNISTEEEDPQMDTALEMLIS